MEIWDLVDESGRLIGVRWPRERHDEIPEGCYHMATEVWVRVGERVLLTRRHPNKTDGLKYDCPGGAILSGERPIDGALRELGEEVGIFAAAEDVRYIGAMTKGCCYAMTYLLVLDELPPLSLQESEVVGYLTVTPDELEAMRDELTGGTYRRYLMYREALLGK